MKLKEIKTYQAVQFNKKLDTFFSPLRVGFADLSMESLDHGVRMKLDRKDGDDIVIPYANIAYYKIAEEQEPVAKDSKKAK